MAGASISEHEKRYTEFYRLVGLCIKQWAHVEEALFDLCSWALKTDERVAAVVFFRTGNLETKITLCGELLDARFAAGPSSQLETFPAQWRSIAKKLDGLRLVRNHLVHAPTTEVIHLVGVLTDDPAKRAAVQAKNPTSQYWTIRTSAREKLRGKAKALDELRQEDLEHHFREIRALLKQMWGLLRGLREAQPG